MTVAPTAKIACFRSAITPECAGCNASAWSHDVSARRKLPCWRSVVACKCAHTGGVLDPPFGQGLGGWNVCGKLKKTSC